MDLSQLTPLPLAVHNHSVVAVDENDEPRKRGQRACGDLFPSVARNCNPADAEFFVLARKFADVCERRGWSVRRSIRLKNTWVIISELDNTLAGPFDNWLEAWQGAIAFDAKCPEKKKEPANA